MKNFILILAFSLFSIVSYSQDFWQHLSCPGYVKTGIVVSSDGSIFCSSTSDGIQMSNDEGLTWQPKNNGNTCNNIVTSIDLNIDGILFINTNCGISRSVDSGNSWQQVYSQTYWSEHDIIKCGFDSIILSGGMNYGAIVRSVDNGLTWQIVLNCGTADYFEQIQDIVYGIDGVIYSCSSIYYPQIDVAGKVYKSIDYGRTWTLYWDPGFPTSFTSIAIDKEGRLLAGGGRGIFRQDIISGQWEQIALNTIVQDILIVSDSLIFLGCDDSGGGWGGVVASIDGGDTYTEIHNDGLLIPGAYRFAISTDGRILMNSSWHLYISRDNITNSQNVPISNEALLMYYPNPCKELLYLKSDLNIPIICHLYNVQSVQMLSFIIPAQGDKKLDLSTFPSGLYFVKYNYNNINFVIKLVHY